jgi:uncharacterized protein (DUF433 family)
VDHLVEKPAHSCYGIWLYNSQLEQLSEVAAGFSTPTAILQLIVLYHERGPLGRGCSSRSAAGTIVPPNPRRDGASVLRQNAMIKAKAIDMATLDWSQCSVVESIPGKVSGAWVFRGTRVPVSAVFENLKTSSIEEVLENFHVTREQVQTVLDFAAKSAQPPLQASQVG